MTPLAGELIGLASAASIDDTVFYRKLIAGEYERSDLRPLALAICRAADCFPQLLASILAICPLPAIRRRLLENLLEEEGVVRFEAGSEAIVDAQRAHTRLARQFASALGVSEAEIAEYRMPPSQWMDQRLAAGDWIAVLAFVAVGYESCLARAYILSLPALRKMGFTDHELAFFIEHSSADERHGQAGAEMIAAVARNERDTADAHEGVRQGVASWTMFHRLLDRACRSARRIPV